MARQPLSVRWRSYRRGPCSRLPRAWRGWLLDSGSLTRRLKRASAGDFRVEVLFQGWSRPTLSEARALGIAPSQQVLVREVRLWGLGEPWVCARSIIPATTLTGPQRRLKFLGERPLGAVLFNDPSMHRGPIETAQLPLNGTRTRTRAWARRSVFRLEGKPLLVSEIFLPSLLQVQ
nr:chorismate lyase [Motiliproteus sp. SC1-56]